MAVDGLRMSALTKASVLSRFVTNDTKNKCEDNEMGLDGIRLSALTNAYAVGRFITDVTLGPNSKCDDQELANNRSEGICELGEKNPPRNSAENNCSIRSCASDVEKNCGMNSIDDDVRSTEIAYHSSRKLLRLLNEQRQERVKDLIKERFLKLEEDIRISRLELYSKHQYHQRERQEARARQYEELILRQLQEDEILANQRQQRLAQEREQHAQRMNEWNEKIKEASLQKEAEEETRKIMKERKIQLEKMHQYQLEYQTKCEQIAEAERHCKDRQALVAKVSCYSMELKSLNEGMDQLVKQCQIGEFSNSDLHTASSLIQQIDAILAAVCKEAEIINEQDDKTAAEASAAKQEDSTAQTSPLSQHTQAAECNRTYVNEFGDIESCNLYLSLQQHLRSVENSCENLQKDVTLKKFRFELQKAVNIPVNAISPRSAEHLEDKLFKLSRLISGQSVEVIHGKPPVAASSHPEGIVFCKNLLAKKLVLQGEHTMSTKSEATFAVAAVIEALWEDFPDFGELILGHFHRECPYLVPVFLPKVEGQSTEDHYRSLGYRYNEDGEIEEQNRFINRMSGIMRLYAAILVTRPYGYQQNKIHPHGLSQAWRWIACILNMEPRPDISAALLYNFLDIAGSAMYYTYGRQFQKLLHLVCKEYFPKIEKITPADSKGPVARLEVLLQKMLKQGPVPAHGLN